MTEPRRARLYALGVFLAILPVWLGWARAEPAASASFLALSALYVATAAGLSWGRFWIRWLALGLSGGGALLLGLVLHELGYLENHWLFSTGILVLHLLPLALLRGEAMAKSFDGEGSWRHDLGLDEARAHVVQRSLVAIGFALPLALHFVLNKLPISRKPELGWSALILIVLGTWGLLRMKTWALSALSSAAVLLLMLSLTAQTWALSGLASAALAIALAPWIGPVSRGALSILRGR